MHGWDLARAAGTDETLDPDVMAALWAFAEALSGMLSFTGYFSSPVATYQIRLPCKPGCSICEGVVRYGESASQPAQPLMRQLNTHISGQ